MNERVEPAAPPAAARAEPRWRAAVVLLASVAGVAIALRLGFWQIERASLKVALQDSLAARAVEPPLSGAALARRAQDVPAQEFRRVRLGGAWAIGQTVYLENRQMDGKVGFFVVTPLVLGPAREAVLVQRGWVPRHFDQRTALPPVATAPGPVEIDGIVALAPSRMLELGAAASGPIRQNVDPASFARETGLELLPLVVVETGSAGNPHDGLERHWPAPASDVQKNYGYAFQWFAIGAVIAFLHVWFRIVRPRQRRRRDRAGRAAQLQRPLAAVAAHRSG
ncbi:MAG: SURF1 family protein [Caldimonas sp.]